MRALTIANANDADTGLIGDRFREHGYSFDECHREHPGEWPELDGHDLVLLLGSEWSVYWPEVADKVQAEVALLQEAERRGIPVFGICFGNQVMAHAFGGSVVQGRRRRDRLAGHRDRRARRDRRRAVDGVALRRRHRCRPGPPRWRAPRSVRRRGMRGRMFCHAVPSGGARRRHPPVGDRLR